ncbi:MAG: histidine kinase dimerization/phospho-acceptor domain-containing protein, partial [Polyangiaceae bacterium]
MSERRGSPVIWGVRRAKTLESKITEVASIIDALAKKAEPFAGPRGSLDRDPGAVASALDALREQHEELLVANEELRAQVDELQSMEQVVYFERARAEAIFFGAPDAYVLTDSLGIIREANLAAMQLVNIPERFLVGKPFASFVDRIDSERARELVTIASQGETVEGNLRVRPRRALDSIPTAAIVTPFDKGAALFWRLRVLHATTSDDAPARDEQLEQERGARIEQEKANDAKDRMIALVSHDLRAPLNSILGWTEVLRQSDVDEPTRQKALATIERSGRAQATLIEDLLDISRITAGKLKVQRATMDLSLLVRRAVDAVRPTADAKHI